MHRPMWLSGPLSLRQPASLVPPPSTILDGDGRFQILRAGRASHLKLERLRFEDGRAVEEGTDDPRDSLGGAVNALGRLLMTNTALRGHRAINGGALYTEGVVRIERSVMSLNSADRCGGMIYSAGKTTIAGCKLESNR